MTHTETNDTAVRGAAPGAMAPPQAFAKPAARQKKATPQRRLRTATAKPGRNGKAKAKATRTKQAAAPRAESKGAQILALIRRSQGATLAQLRKTTGWQAHSVRGFLSTAAKKHGLQIESTQTEGGDRVYHIGK